MLENNGRHDWIRTSDLFRVNLARLGFSTTYKPAGTAKVRGSRVRQQDLWVGLWVNFCGTFTGRNDAETPNQIHLPPWRSQIFLPRLIRRSPVYITRNP